MGKYSLSLAEIQKEVDKVNNARTLPVLQKVTEPTISTSSPQGVKDSLGGTGLKIPSLVDMNKAMWESNLPLQNMGKEEKRTFSDWAKGSNMIEQMQEQKSELQEKSTQNQTINAQDAELTADLQLWSNPEYKMTDDDKAKFEEYKKRISLGGMYGYQYADLTGEQLENYKAVSDKLNPIANFAYGLTDNPMAKAAVGLYSKAGADYQEDDAEKLKQGRENAYKQNLLATGAGALVGQMANYNMGSKVAESIPVLNKVTSAVGSAAEKLTKSKDIGNAAKSILGDTALDVALDTIPSAIENSQSGMSAGEVAKEVSKNIGTNLAFNVGGEVIGSVAKNLLPKLSKGVNDSVKEPGKYSLSQIVDKISKKSQNEIFDPVEKALKDPNVGKNHTAEQLKQMEDYYNSSDSGIIDFAKKARSGEYVKPIEITTVTDSVSKKIKELTGIDTVGNKVVLDKESLGHIDKRHGVNGSADHSMADDSTLSRIGYILNNYDGAVKGQGSNYLRLANGELAPTVVFYKKVDGTYYVVEAVTDAKSKTNRITSAYISDVKPEIASKKEAYQVPDAIIPRRTSEAELELTSFDNSIPVLKNNVNTPPKTMAENIGLAEESIFVPVGKDGTIGNISRVRTNTLENSGLNTADELVNKYLDESNFKYESVSEKESMDIATSRVAENIDDWKNKLMERTEYTGADVDTMMMIYSDTVNRARATGDEALWKEAGAIFKKIQEAGTKSGQAIQAFAKWSRNTPEGIVADTFRNVKEKATSTLGEKKAQKLVDDLTAELQKDIYELAEVATREGVDSKAGQQAYAEIGKIVDKNTPKSITGIVKSYLMDSMLLNFRTLISRNAGGNLGYNSMEFLRQPVTAGIDAVTSKFTGQRTRTGWNTDKIASAFSGLAKGITDEVSDIRKGIHTAKSGQNTITDAIYTNAHPFKGNNFFTKALNKIDDITKHGLSIGDRPFYEVAYKQRLSELNDLRQRGLLSEEAMKLSDEDFNVMAELSAKIDGLTATYQDDGAMAKALTRLKNAVGDMSKASVGADILSQFVMPFTKTPGNIITRSLEYSPYGLVKNAVNTVNEVRKENFNQQRFVDEAGRNILGTALFGAGVAAYDNGLINGGYSDDKDMANAQKQAGMQEYALNTGKGNFDISWIPVLGNDLVAAAAFKEAYDADSDNLLKAGIQGGLSGANTLLNTSTLQGMNRMFGGNTSYSSEQNLLGNAKDSLTSGFGQAIPSLLRQVTQSADPYQRNISNGDREYWQNNLMASLPVLRQELQPKVDNEGNIMMQNQGRDLGSRIIENMISPGQYTEIQDSVVNNEAMRLFESTGNNYAFLPTANRNDIKNGDMAATDEQFFNYQVSLGKKNSETAQAVIESDYYAGLSDEEKEKALQDVYSAMKTVAKEEFVDGYASDDKIAAAYKENGTQGVIDYMQKDYELESRGLTDSKKANEIYSKSGTEGLDQYAEYKSILDGAEVSTSGAYEKIFSDKGAAGLTEAVDIVKQAGGSSRSDLLPVLQKVELTDAERGEYLQYFGGDLSQGALYAKSYYGDAGVYQYYAYKDGADKDGNGSASGKEIEAYLRDLDMANTMRAQWYDILAKTKKNPFE